MKHLYPMFLMEHLYPTSLVVRPHRGVRSCVTGCGGTIGGGGRKVHTAYTVREDFSPVSVNLTIKQQNNKKSYFLIETSSHLVPLIKPTNKKGLENCCQGLAIRHIIACLNKKAMFCK